MIDDEVIELARSEGVELAERIVKRDWCAGFGGDGDDRYPSFLEEHQAIAYARSWLRGVRVFEEQNELQWCRAVDVKLRKCDTSKCRAGQERMEGVQWHTQCS